MFFLGATLKESAIVSLKCGNLEIYYSWSQNIKRREQWYFCFYNPIGSFLYTLEDGIYVTSALRLSPSTTLSTMTCQLHYHIFSSFIPNKEGKLLFWAVSLKWYILNASCVLECIGFQGKSFRDTRLERVWIPEKVLYSSYQISTIYPAYLKTLIFLLDRRSLASVILPVLQMNWTEPLGTPHKG